LSVEGLSLWLITRLTGVHRTTVMSLMVALNELWSINDLYDVVMA
jgi:hypothetical protein